MSRKTKLLAVITVLSVTIIATVFTVQHYQHQEPLFEMVIPDEALFVNAPDVGEDPLFDVSFSFNDTKPPERAQGNVWQEIRWDLSIYPKPGAEAKDVYCTLILDDWILSRSSSPSLKYMGAERGMAGDIPADTKGIAAGMQKYVDKNTLNNSFYETAMTTPVKIMLAYDGIQRYYIVTPHRVLEN